MQAIEFNTFISQGIIKLPVDYSHFFNKNVKIIILIPENEPKTNYNKDKLFSAFHKAQELNIFKDIKNSRQWQKQLRNEWE